MANGRAVGGMILVSVIVVGFLFYVPRLTPSQPEIASNPAACSAGLVVNQVGEDSSGGLTYSCVSASGGSDPNSSPASCAAGFFVTAASEVSGALSYTCTQVSWGQLINFPAACPSGQYVTLVGASLTCSNVPDTLKTCTASCTLDSVTEAVDANSASALTLTVPTALVVSYYVEDVGAGTASVCPPAGPTLFIGGKSYTSTSCFSLPQSYQLSLWSDGTNWFGIATQIQWSQLTGFPGACASGSFISQLNAAPVCTNSVSYITAQINSATTTPTLVQHQVVTFTAGTSESVSFNSNLGAKNTAIVCLAQSGTASSPIIVSNTLGLAFSPYGSASQTKTASVVACSGAMTLSGGADTLSLNYQASCSATDLCVAFLNEASGTDTALVDFTTGVNSGAGGTTSGALTSLSFANTPLLLAFYQKGAGQQGTDTAGTSFSLLNGETGLLLYGSELSSSFTSTSSQFPMTFGTSANFAGVGIAVVQTTVFKSFPLAASTNYVFSCSIDISSASGTSMIVFVRDYLSTSTGQAGSIVGTTSNSLPISQPTDENYLTTGQSGQHQEVLWGSVSVGAVADTLSIEFGVASSTTNGMSLFPSSYCIVTPTS